MNLKPELSFIGLVGRDEEVYGQRDDGLDRLLRLGPQQRRQERLQRPQLHRLEAGQRQRAHVDALHDRPRRREEEAAGVAGVIRDSATN